MKINKLIISLPFLITLIIALGLISYSHAQSLTADSILQVMTETMNPEQSKGIMQMTIVTTSGQKRIFEYEAYSKGKGEKSLLKYLSPQRVKGQTILMLNHANDIWTFFSATRRIRKLATHAKKQKLEGSDFSYEDLGASNEFIDEYNAVVQDEEKKQGKICYKLKLTRKPKSSSGYSRVVLWIDKTTFVPLVVDYFHDKDSLLLEKELVLSDIELIDGINTPKKYVMTNKLDNTQTLMEIIEMSYKVDLPDAWFTEMGMQK